MGMSNSGWLLAARDLVSPDIIIAKAQPGRPWLALIYFQPGPDQVPVLIDVLGPTNAPFPAGTGWEPD